MIHLAAMDDGDILSYSYGEVTSPVLADPQDWQAARGTLVDPRIFGWTEPFECACGKFAGERNECIVCDVCGVRTGDPKHLRRERFGHIRLCVRIPHPLQEDAEIGVLPVLPIAYRRDDPGGRDLDRLYARLIEANLEETFDVESGLSRHRDRLSLRARELFMNERLPVPVSDGDWPVHSLMYFLADTGRSPAESNVFLQAVAMRVVADPPG